MANPRPYRVGMARPVQRYIAPDAIYDDLVQGPHVEMPRQFPFSWNPVNGIPRLAGNDDNQNQWRPGEGREDPSREWRGARHVGFQIAGADDVANQWRPGEGREDPRRETRGGRHIGFQLGRMGLGASAGDQFLDLIKEVGGGVVKDGKKAVEDNVSSGATEFLRSSAGKALLVAVEAKAAEGVTKVVKKQAPNLMLLAVAGGAVGGAVSDKLGKAGTIGALLIAGWAVKQILDAGNDIK